MVDKWSLVRGRYGILKAVKGGMLFNLIQGGLSVALLGEVDPFKFFDDWNRHSREMNIDSLNAFNYCK